MKEKNDNLIRDGNIYILFPILNKTTRQKISKETEDLNNTINQLDLNQEQHYKSSRHL